MTIKTHLTAALLTPILLAGPLVPAHAAAYPFRDPSLPLAARVGDLLGRLTLAEKVSLLHQYEPAIPRLGIKAFKTGTEALHGYAWTSDADGNQIYAEGTVFPQAIGLASTWDPALITRVGRVVGTEARAYHATNDDRQLWGLNVWAPVVNLLRDPRWGRNEEGYSEDPLLTGAISTAYGKGLTGGDPDHLLTAPTLKHYLAYNNEASRGTSDSQVPPRVLNEYDRAAFRPAIAAGAATGVMASYNEVNGRPNVVNPDLDGVVRSWTPRDLLNVTDAGSPDSLAGPGTDPTWNTHYYADYAHGDAAILKAGIDSFTVNNGDAGPTTTALNGALDHGLITAADVNRAAGHILAIRFRLGEFDPGGGRYGGITSASIDTPADRALNRRTAARSAVLLKNSGHALPLPASTRKVAVVGPLAGIVYADWYAGHLPYAVTPAEGIKARLGAGGTVDSVTGDDRIALKDVTTGNYVTAGAGAAGAALKLADTAPAATSEFDVTDWGDGIATLRSAANDRYVGYSGDRFVNDQAQPGGWYVQQQFKLEKRPDGNYVIRYAGYDTNESWWSGADYLTAGTDGTLKLGAKTAAEATEFGKETIRSGTEQVAAAVRGTDQAVVVVGSMPFVNGRENHDRPSLNLPEGQRNLIKAALAANPRTTVVLENSYPTAIGWEQRHAPAILWTTHAGAETGNALADVLFGAVNPSGHLTQTWYASDADLPPISRYDIIGADRTYLYYTGKPLYPFGYGLSYSTFRYGTPRLSRRTIGAGGRTLVSVDVTNTSKTAGDAVVQLYIHQRTSRDKEPVRKLAGFRKVRVGAGRTVTVRIPLAASSLAHWDVTRDRWVAETSAYDVMAGSSATDIAGKATLDLDGERIPARDLTRTTAAEDYDAAHGTTLADESKASGTAVAGEDGGWLAYRDAGLRGPAAFTARVSATGAGTLEVRLDSPTGRRIGAAPVTATAGPYTYTTVTAALTRVTGRHDVYLVPTTGLRVADFRLR